jgi:hypothetical protein
MKGRTERGEQEREEGEDAGDRSQDERPIQRVTLGCEKTAGTYDVVSRVEGRSE